MYARCMDPSNLRAESWLLLFFGCTCCLPWGRRCAAVPLGVRSACCRIGAWIDSFIITCIQNLSSTVRIPLVLRFWSLFCQQYPPSPSVSSNTCHTVLGDISAARCAPSPCLVLILTESSSLCLNALAPVMSWKIQGMPWRMPLWSLSSNLVCEWWT